MNSAERFDLGLLATRLRAAANQVEQAVKVLEAAEAAEALVARMAKLLATAAEPVVGRPRPAETVRELRSATMPVGASRVGAVFDQEPEARRKFAMKSTGGGRPPF